MLGCHPHASAARYSPETYLFVSGTNLKDISVVTCHRATLWINENPLYFDATFSSCFITIRVGDLGVKESQLK
jgi:hypothetical protein